MLTRAGMVVQSYGQVDIQEPKTPIIYGTDPSQTSQVCRNQRLNPESLHAAQTLPVAQTFLAVQPVSLAYGYQRNPSRAN